MNDRVEELVDFVLAQTVSPVDRWGVAATLESRGLRDLDAVERFGRADIFDLADEVHARCRERLRVSPPPAPAIPAIGWYRRAGRFLVFYLRGAFFAMPMAVQIVSVVVLGYALWSSLRFDETQATIVAVGTVGSFVVTGGFVQAVGRLGLYYSEQGSHGLAQRAVRRLVRLGLATALSVGAGAWVLNLLTSWFPQTAALVALAYYLLLSALWLALSVLYTLQRRLAILLSTTLGLGVIGLVLRLTPLAIQGAHWLGLGASVAAAGWWGARVLRRRAERMPGDAELARLPRASILAYLTGPYFAYGILYFSYLFLDRLVAWSAEGGSSPFLIWFRTPYELGLDWALLSMVPTIALLEYTINEFSATIIPVQRRFSGLDLAAHNRYFRRFYLRQVLLLAVLTAASAVATYKGVLWFRQFDEVEQVRDFFASPVTFRVFFGAAAGYGLLVFGLLGGVFLFSLSRPWFVLRALAVALAVDFGVGLVLSRAVDYWLGVLGLAVGSLVFAALMARSTARVLRRLDYYYYSAY